VRATHEPGWSDHDISQNPYAEETDRPAPSECDFTDPTVFDDGGNNWCMRGYYNEDNIDCTDQSASTGWAPTYVTQADHDYCTCHDVPTDSKGRYPVSVGIWFKGNNNPQELDINTSNQQTDDGRCASYQLADGSVPGNGASPTYTFADGTQFFCLWINGTNVPQDIVGFSTKKYVGNPQCPYE
jgi:hypothetical protein